jgi:VanZ family protein
MLAPAALWPAWVAWTAFVVYGSLIPFDFHPLPWGTAWQRLLQAPMLELGVQSRADWIANGVLYLPVGFLATGSLMGAGQRIPGGHRRVGVGRRLVALVLGLVFGAALAVAVEFSQSAFPPRTVSRNDLLAESVGTVLGALAAFTGGPWVRQLVAGLLQDGPRLLRPLLLTYAAGYLFAALFPFDLLVSASEWRDKLGGPQVGWLVTDHFGQLNPMAMLAKLASETLACVPLGLAWAAWRTGVGAHRRQALIPALLVGGLVGAALECAQLALASGQSQGLSVATRATGIALGLSLWQRRQRLEIESLRALLRRRSRWILLGLLVALPASQGLWRGPWTDPGRAVDRLLHEVRFLPFYYHYFTTELHALVSLLAVLALYCPFGLLAWAWHVSVGATPVMVMLLAALVESAKLLSLGSHPDPTNVWLAGASVWLTQSALARASRRPPARVVAVAIPGGKVSA